MATLYHGTSSRFISNIIKNGLGVLDTAGKYAEIRNVLSKYIKPDILTDEFFDKYAGFIDSGSFSSIYIRQKQAQQGNGPFGVLEADSLYWPKYYAAPEYAKATTSWGAREFEHGIVRFLNTIQQRLEDFAKTDGASQQYKDFLTLLKDNAKPEYIKPDGKLNFYTDGNYAIDFPILIKFDVPDSEIIIDDNSDTRTRHHITPEQITGIAFLPPFYYDDAINFDRMVPDLRFLSKEEFLQELNKRAGKRHWNEMFETKDSDGNTKYIFLFPTDDIACVQEFLSGEISYSHFFARSGHINKGKIAQKRYNHGKPYECEFFNNGRLTARVMFKDGKPASCAFFNERGEFSGQDYFVTGKDGKYHLELMSNKLNKKRMFILDYEKQPQKMSDKSKAAYIQEKKEEIKSRLKTGASILQNGSAPKENTNPMLQITNRAPVQY